MQKELVIYYLKRHALILVGLLMAAGFVGYGYVFMTGAEAGKANQGGAFEEVKARREKISNPSNNIKIDPENIGKIQTEVDRIAFGLLDVWFSCHTLCRLDPYFY